MALKSISVVLVGFVGLAPLSSEVLLGTGCSHPTPPAIDRALLDAVCMQVRVRVIEGRQLAGGNISPVVRVTVEKQSRQTRVKKATNKPLYDEAS